MRVLSDGSLRGGPRTFNGDHHLRDRRPRRRHPRTRVESTEPRGVRAGSSRPRTTSSPRRASRIIARPTTAWPAGSTAPRAARTCCGTATDQEYARLVDALRRRPGDPGRLRPGVRANELSDGESRCPTSYGDDVEIGPDGRPYTSRALEERRGQSPVQRVDTGVNRARRRPRHEAAGTGLIDRLPGGPRGGRRGPPVVWSSRCGPRSPSRDGWDITRLTTADRASTPPGATAGTKELTDPAGRADTAEPRTTAVYCFLTVRPATRCWSPASTPRETTTRRRDHRPDQPGADRHRLGRRGYKDFTWTTRGPTGTTSSTGSASPRCRATARCSCPRRRLLPGAPAGLRGQPHRASHLGCGSIWASPG